MTTPIFAEEAVIGGLLHDNMRFHDVATLLSIDHFTSPQRARVYGAMTYPYEGVSAPPAVCTLTGAMGELTGVVRLSPGAFEDPTLAHGTIEADGTTDEGPVHLSMAF